MAASKQPKGARNRQLFSLWVHDNNFSQADLVINPDFFPADTQIHNILEIYKPNNREKRLYLRIGAVSSVKANLQLSLKDSIAQTFDLANRDEVVATIVTNESVTIDFVELLFKDQHISRSDMWRLKLNMQNDCVYVNKNIAFSSMRGQVKELLAGGQQVVSGLITPNTKFIFRSRSAELMLFFQMSKEMWDFADDGMLYFEKAVTGFLPLLFEKWQQTGANHSLTIVLFSRTIYTQEVASRMEGDAKRALQTDLTGRPYHDFYTVVCQNERGDFDNLIFKLKKKFIEYPEHVNWKLPSRNIVQDPNPDENLDSSSNAGSDSELEESEESEEEPICGENSSADASNFLEAINLGHTMLDKRSYVDCDLTRTGQIIVVVSAGTGVFHVDAALAQDTKQRMIDRGIGCDLVCLTKPPLHVVPLLILHKTANLIPPNNSSLIDSARGFSKTSGVSEIVGSATSRSRPGSMQGPSFAEQIPSVTQTVSTNPTDEKMWFYKVAHWIYLFFFETNKLQGAQTLDFLSTSRTFVPSCKMPDIQFRNVIEKSGAVIPYRVTRKPPAIRSEVSSKSPIHKSPDELAELASNSKNSNPPAMDQYDATIFARAGSPLRERERGLPRVKSMSSISDASSSSRPHAHARSSSSVTTEALQKRKARHLSARSEETSASSSNSRASGGSGRSKESPARARQGSVASSPEPATTGSLQTRAQSKPTTTTVVPPASSGATSSSSSVASSTSKKPSNTDDSLNPFNHEYSAPRQSSNRRRWAHLFPRSAIQHDFTETDPHGPHWRSLTQPASLPLTTDYLPSQTELNKDFEEYPHTLAFIPEDNIYQDKIDDMMKELISQRLLQGYQLVVNVNSESNLTVPPTPMMVHASSASSSAASSSSISRRGVSSSGANTTGVSSNAAPATALPIPTTARSFTLSAGHSFHKINYEASSQQVEVKRYHRKKSVTPQSKPIAYRYFLVSGLSQYTLKDTVMSYQSTSLYKWNYLDQIISGYAYDFMDQLNFWRIKLMMVPLDRANRNNAPAAFEKFKEMLSQKMAKTSDDDFNKIIVNIVAPETPDSPGGATKFDPTHLRSVVVGLKKSVAGDRKYKGKTHQASFLGSEAIDWVMANVRVKSRQGAVDVAQQLLRAGMVKNISLTHDTFVDGPHYYCLSSALLQSQSDLDLTTKPTIPAPTFSSPQLYPRMQSSPSKSIPGGLPLNVSASFDPRSSSYLNSNPTMTPSFNDQQVPRSHTLESPPELGKPIQELHRKVLPSVQRAIRIELDKSKTERYEWSNLLYDTTFDPDVVYELELQWLVGTGGVVSDFLNGAVRRARGSGLLLQTIPVDHKTPHPFYVPTRRPIDFNRFNQLQKLQILKIFSERLDFIQRKNPDQFIHRSACLLVDYMPAGFEWTLNWTDAGLQTSNQTQEVIRRFLEFCCAVDSATISDAGDVVIAAPMPSANHSSLSTSSSAPATPPPTATSEFDSPVIPVVNGLRHSSLERRASSLIMTPGAGHANSTAAIVQAPQPTKPASIVAAPLLPTDKDIVAQHALNQRGAPAQETASTAAEDLVTPKKIATDTAATAPVTNTTSNRSSVPRQTNSLVFYSRGGSGRPATDL